MGKKKLLWWSDSPRIAHVGQSVVARECLSRLQEHYIVEALGFGNADDPKPVDVPYNVIHCSRTDVIDPNKCVEYIRKSNPDIVLASHDPWLYPSIGQIRNALPKTKFIGWLTIDGSPAYYKFYDMIKPYNKVLTPTNFCKKTFEDRWMDLNISTVPYGVDHSIFHAPKQGKEELKRQLYQESQGSMPLANRFTAFYVGANQDRKNLGLIHEAWREFEKGKEQSVVCIMFTHSASLKEEVGTYDLFTFINDTKTLIVNTHPQPKETIGRIMAASDILFHPSTGEGFGLTLLEAMASGAVPITVPFAGCTDFCNDNNSYLIPYITFVGGFHCHRAIASVDETVKQLELAYSNRELREKKALDGIETAKQFTWNRTVEMLRESIEEVLNFPDNAIGVKRLV